MKLEAGEEYELNYSGQFCHMSGAEPESVDRFRKGTLKVKGVFVGTIPSTGQTAGRNVFYCSTKGVYLMFSAYNEKQYVNKESEFTEEQQSVIDSLTQNIDALKKQFRNEQ